MLSQTPKPIIKPKPSGGNRKRYLRYSSLRAFFNRRHFGTRGVTEGKIDFLQNTLHSLEFSSLN